MTSPQTLGLGDRLELHPYLPRREVLAVQKDSEALLLLIPDSGGRGRAVLSAKVFEYLAAERPILAVVPTDGAAADLIRETGAGTVVAPDDVDGLRAAIENLEADYRGGRAERDAALPRAQGAPVAPHAVAGARRPDPEPDVILRRVTSFFFLATLFTVSFEKIQWELAGTIGLAGILAVLFVASFALERLGEWPRRIHRTVAIVLLFAAAFLVVYLAGFFNIESEQARPSSPRGSRGSRSPSASPPSGSPTWRDGRCASTGSRSARSARGIALNGAYGVAQLAFAETGRDLDQTLLGPLLGDARSINFYGSVEGADVYRPNALTNDPNHLGIVLLLPLLILTPLYLRLERGHPLRVPLMVLLPFLLLVELATLSRSGLLGLLVGLLVLLFPYGRRFVSAAVLVPLGALVLALAVIVSRRVDFFETVVRSRLDTDTGSTATHFEVYELIRPALEGHLLFGLGLNTFSVYYEAVTGLTNWGPHSFYAALVIETGIVGAALFATFIWWLFKRLHAGHRLGKALAVMRDPLAARVRPLAWGLTAAVLGVMAANAFYLTMQQSYFYALAMLALALPVVFGRRITTA